MSNHMSFFLGIGCALGSTALSSYGLVLQSNTLRTDTGNKKLARYFGFFLYAIGQVGASMALVWISPMILAPLSTTSLIFNLIFARLILKTTIHPAAIIAAFLLCIGGSLVSLFGSHLPTQSDDFERTIAKIAEPTFFLYIMISTATHMLIYITAILIEQSFTKFSSLQIEPIEELDPLIGDEFVQQVVPSSPPQVPVLTILYGLAGGFFGSHTLFMAKCGIELVVSSIVNRRNDIIGWPQAILVLYLTTTIIVQVIALNKGLYYSSPTFCVPIFVIVYILFSVANSFMALEDIDDYLGPTEWSLGGTGLFLIVIGVAFLSTSTTIPS